MTAATAPPRRAAEPLEHVDQPTKLAYGFGAVAYGIKDNGFSVFLLIFYQQVVGLDAGLVGLMLLLALVADALIDPVVGHLSDRTRSRWGRRHPWMYASAIPIALLWVAVWNPPDWGEGAQLAYLLVVAIGVRASLAAYEVPSIALAPEMTRDYHERTSILGWRYVFGWAGGLAMLALAYGVFLRPEPGFPDGLLNANGYGRFALVGAAGMLVAVLVSAIGTHRRFARPPAVREEHVPGLGAVFAAFRFPPFLMLMSAVVFSFTAQGLNFSLSNYMLLYVWQIPQALLIVYALALFAGVGLSMVVAQLAGRRLGKAKGAALLAVVGATMSALPYLVFIVGAVDKADGATGLALLFAAFGLATMGNVGALILGGSMLADVTDASWEETGRREEGVFFAGYFFLQKSVTGIGIFLSGLILSGIGFPDKAVPGEVARPILSQLATVFALAVLTAGLLAAWRLGKFPLRPPAEPLPAPSR